MGEQTTDCETTQDSWSQEIIGEAQGPSHKMGSKDALDRTADESERSVETVITSPQYTKDREGDSVHNSSSDR